MDDKNLIPALLIFAGLIYAGKQIGDLAGELHAVGSASDTISRLFNRDNL